MVFESHSLFLEVLPYRDHRLSLYLRLYITVIVCSLLLSQEFKPGSSIYHKESLEQEIFLMILPLQTISCVEPTELVRSYIFILGQTQVIAMDAQNCPKYQ